MLISQVGKGLQPVDNLSIHRGQSTTCYVLGRTSHSLLLLLKPINYFGYPRLGAAGTFQRYVPATGIGSFH